jgi:hypothetical protein
LIALLGPARGGRDSGDYRRASSTAANHGSEHHSFPGTWYLVWTPTSMVMVDAGVIGIEYASMFAALGAKVTAADLGASGTVTTLASDQRIPAEVITYFGWAAGPDRSSGPGRRGGGNRQLRKVFVDEELRTQVDHIYAVGDVIGFPALAPTSMEQGRLAAYHVFGEPTAGTPELQPIGIYTIPQVSYVGATEVELTNDSIAYEVGVSHYRESARAAKSPVPVMAAQTAGVCRPCHATGGACLRYQCDRTGARAGGDGLWRYRRISGGCGVQLPDVRRSPQGRRVGT